MKKNIHILETNQPSRLGYISESKTYHLYNNDVFLDELANAINIYITSDEDIKKSDNFLDLKDNTLWRNHGPSSMSKTLFPECKKIILTTDTTLIADGVQEIDDEFLEWFVKNRSCEYVNVLWTIPAYKSEKEYRIEIPLEEPKPLDNLEERFKRDMSMVVMPLGNENIPEEPKQVICRDKFDRVIQDGYYVDVQNDGVHKVYRKEDGQLYFKPYGEEERVSNYFSNDLILIPYSTKLIMDLKKEIADKKQDVFYNKKQEEPKQETRVFGTKDDKSFWLDKPIQEGHPDKQETLEESAFSFTAGRSVKEVYSRMDFINGAKFGAKWQAERMYSEEEVYSALQKLRLEIKSGVQKWQEDFEFDLDKWFEQHKKK